MATVNFSLKRGLTCLALSLLRAYRYFLSPWLGFQCRFHPTCSRFAMEAFQNHGFWKGSLFSLSRLLRCHPWHPGGIDFVPLKK